MPKLSRNDLVRLINQLQNENLQLQHKLAYSETVLQDQMLHIMDLYQAVQEAGFEIHITLHEHGSESP